MQKNILTNVVIILVENAISVCKLREIKNPKVNISATKNSDGVIIKVIDNLGGIKEKNINDIFEKNHSVSTSTGLGLYLVREFLLPKIGGVIDIENTDDGVCFKVYF
jgi:signal transduction histidine kinase